MIPLPSLFLETTQMLILEKKRVGNKGETINPNGFPRLRCEKSNHHPTHNPQKTSTKKYKRIYPIPMKKPPFPKRNPGNRPPMIGGRGGHTSEREKTSTTRKEPENAPDTTPFIPKGALMHTKNRYPKPTV